jgi:dTDP-4-amino-4,6-dideoxygalactose transaminase
LSRDTRLVSQGGPPVRESFLPYALPALGEAEKRAVVEVLESGWITTGPRVERFESALAEATGARHVVCLSSCTAALHLALLDLELSPGDEVITTPLTYAATVNGVVQAGGRPVLVDVEPDTLNLDPERAAGAVGDRTRALLPVHFGGHPCEMDALLETAERHRLRVIEDAAHAIGARYRGRAVGTLGDATCFSFYATKNLTTGEGGALATDSDETAARARLLSAHGISRDAWSRREAAEPWSYEVLTPGFKYNMSDVQAALGLVQLARLEGFTTRRGALARRYDDAFRDHPALEIPAHRDSVGHAYHLYALRLRPEALTCDRARFLRELRAENIGSAVHFIPIHHHPYYRKHLGVEPGAFPVADAAFERIFSLPLYPSMRDEDADDVIEAVAKVAAAFAR